MINAFHPQTDAYKCSSKMINWKEVCLLLAIVVTSFLIRLYFVQFHDVISTDGTSYACTAKAMGKGDFNGISTYGFYPLLIWIVTLTGAGLEYAGRLVSVIMGSLLVIPVYLLGRDIYSKNTGTAAAILTLAWPALLSFSCEVMTQATYNVLTLTGIYLTWRMVARNSIRSGAGAGLFLGLAYLTRPEGLLLFFLIPIPLLFPRRKELRAMAAPLLAYFALFSIQFVINVILIHHATGIWQMSSKTAVALNDGLSYFLNIPDLNYITAYKPRGYLEIARDYPDYFWLNAKRNLREVLNTLLPPPLWILAAIGFLSKGFSLWANASRVFLLSTFAPLVVLIIFYYVGGEYTQPYLPVLFIWAAEGLNRAETRIKTYLEPLQIMKFLARNISVSMIIAIIITLTQVYKQFPHGPSKPYDPNDDDGRRDCKNIGLMLKDNLPPGKIMTRWARIAFYAEREWVNIPKTSETEIYSYARENGVRFLIVDGSLFRMRPELKDLHEPVNETGPDKIFLVLTDDGYRARPGLRPYLLYRDPSSMGVAVYEFVPLKPEETAKMQK